MSLILEYRTISVSNQNEVKEKKSLFISYIFPVTNEEEIEKNLTMLRKKYSDATHHCYAYKLLNGKTKFADDGEPHRTAGMRIMNAIEHHQLTNVLTVVVRYYGGTKLGVGPLGKAYYDSALSAIKPSDIVTLTLHKKIIITFDFTYESLIRRFFFSNKIKIIKENYSTLVECECLFPFTSEVQIINQLQELTNGKISIVTTGEQEYVS